MPLTQHVHKSLRDKNKYGNLVEQECRIPELLGSVKVTLGLLSLASPQSKNKLYVVI